MKKDIITTDVFWNKLKEMGAVPEHLDRVAYFTITGEPANALVMTIVKFVETEDANKILRLLEEYELVKRVKHE